MERHLDGSRRTFEAGNLAGLLDALLWCQLHEQAVPNWARDGAIEMVTAQLTGAGIENGKGRHARWITRSRQDMIDYARVDTIEECRENGIRGERAFEAASKILQGTWAKGSPNTMESSLKRFQRRSKKNPLRYKLFFQDPLRLPSLSKKSDKKQVAMWKEVLKLRRGGDK